MIRKHLRKHLKRDLNLFHATLAGVGIIVGAGIYVLIGAASGHAGNAVWLSFVIAGVTALLTGLSYAELSSIYTEDSGEYSYVEHAFGRKIGFITGYLVVVSLLVSTAAVALGFSGYLSSLLGISNIIPLALLVIILFSFVNYMGIKQSMRLNVLFTSLSILGLIIIIIFSVPYLGSVDYMEMPSMLGVFKGASLIFFAFIGFESVVKLTEETKNPRKNIPLALLLSVAVSTVFYVLVAIAVVSVVDFNTLADSVSPLADVAQVLMGSNAGLIVAIIAIVSTGNTVLLELVAVSRMIYSMAKQYPKIDFLSYIGKKETPTIAIVASMFIICAFVLIGNIEVVAEITNFSIYTVFAVINLALIKIRYIKHKKEMFHEPLNIGKFPVLALIAFIVNIVMIFLLNNTAISLGILAVVVGYILYEIVE